MELYSSSNHIVYLYTTWGDEGTRKDGRGSLGFLDINQKAGDDEKVQKFSRIGLTLLLVGFILQIIENWIQNTPI